MNRGPQLLPQGSELGRVHLHVTDAERARLFWTRYVGLQDLPGDGSVIELGAGDRPLIVLYPGASQRQQPRRTGLYHVAIRVHSRRDLASLVARLATLEERQAAPDQPPTDATYYEHPDSR